MAKHEFGIINHLQTGKWYSDYEPEAYGCISVNDDLVLQIIDSSREELSQLPTYFQVTTQPAYGLDYSGVTIIPPQSLPAFSDLLCRVNGGDELSRLISMIAEAMRDDKHLIHFGI